MVLQEMDSFTVNFPEFKLLREYHMQASSWISRFNRLRVNIGERVDQDNVVEELTNILKDAVSLKIQGLNFLAVLLVWGEGKVIITAVVMAICLIHHVP